MKGNEKPLAHFIGGLRRPAWVGSITLSWPLVGLYVYDDRLEFGPGFKFMRRFERPSRVFAASDLKLVGPTESGVRFTFADGESWIFATGDREAVLRLMAVHGVPTTSDVVPANWWPPL